MKSFLRYIVPISLFVAVMYWVATEYIGLGSAGTDITATASTCVLKGSGESACSTLDSSMSHSSNGSNPHDSQLADSVDSESANEPHSASVFTSNVDTGLLNSSNPDLRSLSTKPLSEEAIGDFIDVDSEFIDTDGTSTDFSEESIGNFIDVDTYSEFLDVLDNGQSIGDFIEVEVGSGLVETISYDSETVGDIIVLDSDMAPDDAPQENIGPLESVD